MLGNSNKRITGTDRALSYVSSYLSRVRHVLSCRSARSIGPFCGAHVIIRNVRPQRNFSHIISLLEDGVGVNDRGQRVVFGFKTISMTDKDCIKRLFRLFIVQLRSI
jgi:hypothetical protein